MMHEKLTEQIIAAAIEVHKQLGPGLLESAYEACLCSELYERGVRIERQKDLPVRYKNKLIDCSYRMDIVVENTVLLELKSVESIADIHRAQMLSYLKLSGLKVGLLMNFNVERLVNGIQRLVL